jgi:hypothetical protein
MGTQKWTEIVLPGARFVNDSKTVSEDPGRLNITDPIMN